MKKLIGLLVYIGFFIGIVSIGSCKEDPGLPILTTNTLTNITTNSGTTGGKITDNGGADITARGVCWSTSNNPTVTGSDTTNDGTGSGSFTSNIDGLTPNTLYHVKAYATNSVGTAYGKDVTFTTNTIVVPTLTTTAVTSIGLTSAVSGGTITSNGGADITAKGVCWATTANPTTTNDKTTDGTGSASFSSNLAGLLPATTYHVRAYATNSAGTNYGNDVTFTTNSISVPSLSTTAITSVTQTTAASGGDITSDGGADITTKGVCWATTANPTINNEKTADGTGTGGYSSSLTGLEAGETYYVRAYATNSVGTGYGNERIFTTSPVILPTLTTTEVTTIAQTTAVSGGNITNNGGGNIIVKGVCWATTLTPTTNNFKTEDGTGTGSFTSTLTGLLPGTTYYVRAYATNSAGIAYGIQVSFTTDPIEIPTISTVGVTSITQTTAVSGGNITADGGGYVSVRGVCWATTTNPTTGNFVLTNGTGIGSFPGNLTGLEPGTTYYVRAYATNSAGTAYGNEVSFTTDPVDAPTLTTTNPSSITLTSAVSGGSIISDGGAAISVSGICWSTSTNPTTGDDRTTDGTSTGNFASTSTGLSSGTRYYVRAYATNSSGTAYGNQVIFNTKMADIEGNTYNTVNIGTQVWMVENLKTTRFNDNSEIAVVTDNTVWSTLSTPAYCWYNNQIINKSLYGALYNWFAVTTGDLCPSGWHVPTDEEFKTLELYLGIPPAQIDIWGWRGTDQGSQLKSTTGWLTGENGTNTSGFTGLPGGYRFAANGSFNDLGTLTYWWTYSENDLTRAWYRLLVGTNSDIYRAATEKRGGKYIRCVKN